MGFFSLTAMAKESLQGLPKSPTKADKAPSLTSISSNPAAVNIVTGTGEAQRYIENQLGLESNEGLKIGGAWLGDVNQLFSGGVPNPKKTTSNSLLLLSLTADTEKLYEWEGGLFGVEGLQLNAQSTSRQAGCVQGYNSIAELPPLNRTELYQLWYRQELFDKKFIVRIGKTVPNYDFDNLIKPVALAKGNPTIPAVSGLIYTPIFVNPTMLGVMPGYYNSAYGFTMNFAPIKEWYLSYGIYDGSLASGKQTGLQALPKFNGTHFQIAETGLAWLAGKNDLPGTIGTGVWQQRGTINIPPAIPENKANGFYLFGSQRLWYQNPGIDSSGISIFYQYGINHTKTLPFKKHMGGGLTAFGLIGNRLDDSFGAGAAFTWLNQNVFQRSTELLLQAYYQAQIIKGIYLEPVVSYIPSPGATGSRKNTWAGTLRAIVLF